MLEFPYMEVPSSVTFQPVVPLFIEGPLGRLIIDVLVDPGADRILLPKRLAERLGVRLTDTPEGVTRSAFGDWLSYFGGQLVLELRVPPSIVRWSAPVAFVDKPARNLLGRDGGLDLFHAHFLGPEHRLILEPQPSLPKAK
jgi:hypothetical protein